MKKIILTTLLSFSLMLGFATPRYTSDYYILDAEKYLDKEVTLRMSYVNLDSHTIDAAKFKQEGYVVFYCRTYYNNEIGGDTYVIIPEKKAKSFASTYTKQKFYDKDCAKRTGAPYKVIMRKKDDTYYFEGK